jgi:nucleoside-diphosphate-sugar epimerase
VKKVLVTGASGFVGSRLCKELTANGYAVRAIHRPASNTEALKALGVELVPGDVNDKESLMRAMSGVENVFHLAALYREAKFPDSEYWKVNFEGTRNVLEAVSATKVKRLIHCSTNGVHGPSKGEPINETAPYGPCDVYQESKTEAEKLVFEWCAQGKVDACILRPTMIWGPGDRRIFKLFKGVAYRMLPVVGDGKTRFHWIFVDDLARAFRLAAENPKTRGEAYLIGGRRIVTLRYTMETIAKVYGVKLLPFRVPALPIQLAGSVVEAICRPLGLEPPLHRRRCDFFIKTRAFDCSKAIRDLGFTTAYDFEDECAFVANWYRDNGWIKL